MHFFLPWRNHLIKKPSNIYRHGRTAKTNASEKVWQSRNIFFFLFGLKTFLKYLHCTEFSFWVLFFFLVNPNNLFSLFSTLLTLTDVSWGLKSQTVSNKFEFAFSSYEYKKHSTLKPIILFLSILLFFCFHYTLILKVLYRNTCNKMILIKTVFQDYLAKTLPTTYQSSNKQFIF